MSVPNIHTHVYPRTSEGFSAFLLSYRLPLLILAFTVTLMIGYNAFFISAIQTNAYSMHTSPLLPESSTKRPSERKLPSALQSVGLFSLIVGNCVFLMFLWSFWRAVVTPAGYVSAEPWQWPPRTDAGTQESMRAEWEVQRQWLEKHAAVSGHSSTEDQLRQEEQTSNTNTNNTAVDMAAPHPHHQTGDDPMKSVLSLQPEKTCRNPFMVREFNADGSLRYCTACAMYKPDYSHHCRLCGSCTVFMDHHCQYLNNCIGAHNYKLFFLTIAYGGVCGTLNSFLFLFFWYFTRQYESVSMSWLLVVAAMLLMLPWVVRLLWYHVTILLRGMTTLERMREDQVAHFMSVMGGSRQPATCCCCWRWCIPQMAEDENKEDWESERLIAEGSKRKRWNSWRQSSAHLRRIFGTPRHWWLHALPVVAVSSGASGLSTQPHLNDAGVNNCNAVHRH